MVRFFFLGLLFILLLSCATNAGTSVRTEENTQIIIMETKEFEETYPQILTALINARIPSNISEKINKQIKPAPDCAFTNELNAILLLDPYLWILVDKTTGLDRDYIPQDLIELRSSNYSVNRREMYLRSAAAASLEQMAAEAKAEGLNILISSAYRSYSYQNLIHSLIVNKEGQEEADKISARPGHSQHQLGLAVDFGSISDDFAETPEGRWITANASRFGWSLTYPKDYENITSYNWESWHYRYLGAEIVNFIEKYFNGIQQYALRFLYEYKNI